MAKRPTITAAQRFRVGKRTSQLWYKPEHYAIVKRAAALDRRPMTQFAIIAAVAEAKKVLKLQAEPEGRGS